MSAAAITATNWIHLEFCQQRVAQQGAKDVNISVSKIHQLQNAVNHAVANGDQGINGTDHYTDNQYFN